MHDIKASMAELDEVWKVIDSHSEVKPHDSCSTHVHVGIRNNWSLQNIKDIAKAWCWWEEEILHLMPEHRRNCLWARSNCSTAYESQFEAANTMVTLYKEAVKNKLFSSLFDFIEETDSIDEIIEKTAPERLLSWNLQNLRNKCGTIEFRRPPNY